MAMMYTIADVISDNVISALAVIGKYQSEYVCLVHNIKDCGLEREDCSPEVTN